MTTTWLRLRRWFGELVDLPAAERDAALAEVRALQPELATQLAELLAAVDRQTTVADVVGEAARTLSDGGDRDFTGIRAGPFHLGERIGAGGMGVVHRAERADGTFDQTVAVKLLPGLAGGGLVRSLFEAERRLLARLEHPYVARIIDGGELDDGTPWLALEYVQGVPLDGYCRDRPVAERVDVLLRVCEAVAHAHRLLVVHRDLKPANILVTDEGIPRLLDFGVAALTEASPTLRRETGLTPAYASPEQLVAGEVTTASDVYALGVLLHQLLTGAVPHRVEQGGLAAWHAVKTSDPDPASRIRDRELRAIARRALAPAPEDRYGSVDALATDLRAWRERRPVAAVAGGAAYALRKLVVRNAATSATALGAVFLVAALTSIYVDRERAARTRAEQEAEKATQVASFLERLFEDVDPANSKGQEITAAQLLRNGEARIEAEFSAFDDVRARLLGVVGRTWRSLGAYTEAEALHRRVLEELPPDAPLAAQARARFDLALALMELRRVDEAFALQQAALGLREEAFEGDAAPLAESYYETGYLALLQRELEEAERLYEASRAMFERLGERFDDRRAAVMMDLAVLRLQSGEPDAGVALGEEALALQRRASGSVHPDVATALNNLGYLHDNASRSVRGIELYREAHAMRTELFGADAPPTVNAATNLAAALWARGDTLEGLDVILAMREAIDAGRRRDDFRFAYYDPDLAEMLLGAQEYERAIAVAREHLAETDDADLAGVGTPARQHQLIAEALDALGRTTEALEEARVVASLVRAPYPDDAYLERSRMRREFRNRALRARLAHRLEPGDETRGALEAVVRAYRERFGGPNPESLLLLSWLAEALARDGRSEASARVADELLAGAEEVFAPDAIDAAALRMRAAVCHAQAGRTEDARAQLRRARDATRRAGEAAEREYRVVGALLAEARALEERIGAGTAAPAALGAGFARSGGPGDENAGRLRRRN